MFRSRVPLFRLLIRYVRSVSNFFSLIISLIISPAFSLLFKFILHLLSDLVLLHLHSKFWLLTLFFRLNSTSLLPISLYAAVVQASNCGPSLLALLHGTMVSASIAAIQCSQRDTLKRTSASSHTSHDQPNRNTTLNKGKGSSNNNDIGSVYRSERDASPLTQLLTSSRFSSNDAHSLPPLIREVSLFYCLLFTVYFLLFVVKLDCFM
jgi:hypothetical protein